LSPGAEYVIAATEGALPRCRISGDFTANKCAFSDWFGIVFGEIDPPISQPFSQFRETPVQPEA
jgi:hypothetical protein